MIILEFIALPLSAAFVLLVIFLAFKLIELVIEIKCESNMSKYKYCVRQYKAGLITLRELEAKAKKYNL